MNKWRDSCVRQRNNIKDKVDSFEHQVLGMKSKVQNFRQESGFLKLDVTSRKRVFEKLQSINDEKMPLILSLVSTCYEDLKQMHSHLDAFTAACPNQMKVTHAQDFFKNLNQLKEKMLTH
jgi:hypothetical protein